MTGAPGRPTARPPQPRTVGEMLDMARAFLTRKGVEEARLEADLLVAHALGVDRLGLLLRLERPVTGRDVDRARDLLVRRGRREPVAYITGTREFWTRPFRVGPGVLVPRPESELLVDVARDAAAERGWTGPRVLDVGTGSGCLAVTIALEVGGAVVTACDVSEGALEIARGNAEALGAEVEWVQGDGLEVGDGGAPWELVVCNPPYVGEDEREDLEPEVLEHEPEEALFAPEGDREWWVRALVGGAGKWLGEGGVMAVELGYQQARTARELAEESGLRWELRKDLAGVERVLVVRRPL